MARHSRGLGCDCSGNGIRGLGAAYLDDYSFGEEIDELQPVDLPPSREPFSSPPRKKRSMRSLKHGSTVWCVFLGKRKKTCHLDKFTADKAARSLKAKRYHGTKVSVRKQKHKLKCPFKGRRVCRTRKGGSCVRWGCSGMKKGKTS